MSNNARGLFGDNEFVKSFYNFKTGDYVAGTVQSGPRVIEVVGVVEGSYHHDKSGYWVYVSVDGGGLHKRRPLFKCRPTRLQHDTQREMAFVFPKGSWNAVSKRLTE